MIKNVSIALILMVVTAGLYAQTADEPDKNTLTPEQEAIQKRIAEYRQKLTDNPSDVELHRAYQNFARQSGNLNDLKEEYLLKMNAEPQNPLYFYLYGRLTEDKELEDSFKRALELEVKTPNPELRFWLYFGFGQFYLDAKKYKESLQYLEIASKLRPDSLDVLHQMALVHYETDNITEAMKLWDNILKIKGDYLDAMLGKALIYKSRGMYDNAIKELENILKIDVAFWRAYEPLIQCYHAKQDYKKGEELRSIIKHLPKKADKLITIDLVSINKKVFVVEEAIVPPPLLPDGESKVYEYYFKQHDKLPDKKLQLTYTVSIYYNLLAASKAKDRHSFNLYRINISDGTENLKSTSYEYQPQYQEILSIIKSIEESR